jgi:serine/threonine-protein kinase
MEYVEGITLKTYIEKKGQLSFKESASIAIQVARGIESAHNKHITHRDIKPQNIIISTEGKVKVTDFGIAKAASSNTISSDVMGSVHYSSPEQARNGFVDGKSDIYSLGIVMYEMVTGRVPFDGDTTVAVAIQHLQEDITPPSTYAENLPISMEKIILKCTQKNPDRRYQTIGDLLADLRRSLVSPNEDFVVIAPLVDNGKTKVIKSDELKQIRESGADNTADPNTEKSAGIASAASVAKADDADLDEDDDDEDDDEEINPKFDKAMTIMVIVLATLAVIVILYLIGSIFGMFRYSGGDKDSQNTETQTETETESESQQAEQVAVKNVTGRTSEEAKQLLEAQGLYMFIVSSQKSNQPEGTVLSQDPEADTTVDVGTTVNVIVAGEEDVDYTTDEEQIAVPSVVGMLEKNAVNTLTNEGFVASKTYQYSDSVDAGKVISQSPSSGMAAKNSTVTLVISQGQQSVTVPSVTGDSEETAKSKLSSAGLKVSSTSAYSDSVDAGKVISQSVANGKMVPAGTTITITVSLGPEKVSYSYSKSYSAPSGAVSASYSVVGSDGVTYASGSTDVDGSLSVSVSDMNCSSGTVSISWVIETTDEEGEPRQSTSDKSYSVKFTKQ